MNDNEREGLDKTSVVFYPVEHNEDCSCENNELMAETSDNERVESKG